MRGRNDMPAMPTHGNADAEDPATCYYVYAAQFGEDTETAAGNQDVSVIQYREDGFLEMIYL